MAGRGMVSPRSSSRCHGSAMRVSWLCNAGVMRVPCGPSFGMHDPRAISPGAGAHTPRAGPPRAPGATGRLPALPFFQRWQRGGGGGACLLADGAGAGPPVISDAGRPWPPGDRCSSLCWAWPPPADRCRPGAGPAAGPAAGPGGWCWPCCWPWWLVVVHCPVGRCRPATGALRGGWCWLAIVTRSSWVI